MMFKIYVGVAWAVVTIVGLIASVTMSYANDTIKSSSEWLGVYVGGGIPGYTVKESDLSESFYSGEAQKEEVMSLMNHVVSTCKKNGGVGVINLRYDISLGPVHKKDQTGVSMIISAGMIARAAGDCVRSVSKNK